MFSSHHFWFNVIIAEKRCSRWLTIELCYVPRAGLSSAVYIWIPARPRDCLHSHTKQAACRPTSRRGSSDGSLDVVVVYEEWTFPFFVFFFHTLAVRSTDFLLSTTTWSYIISSVNDGKTTSGEWQVGWEAILPEAIRIDFDKFKGEYRNWRGHSEVCG